MNIDGAGDDVARIEAEHWRAMADEKAAELQRLKRRPLVRAALALDRRVEPGRRTLARYWKGWRLAGRRVAVKAGATTAAPGRPKRRAALAVELAQLDGAPDLTGRVSVVSLAQPSMPPAGELVCFLPSDAVPLEEGWLARLASVVGGDVVAATPTLIHPARAGLASTEHDLRVRAQGFDLELDRGGYLIPFARGAGTEVHLRGEPSDVAAAPLRGLVVDRAAFVAAGGLGIVDDEDVAGIDLSVRLRARRGTGHARAGCGTVRRPSGSIASARCIDRWMTDESSVARP